MGHSIFMFASMTLYGSFYIYDVRMTLYGSFCSYSFDNTEVFKHIYSLTFAIVFRILCLYVKIYSLL